MTMDAGTNTKGTTGGNGSAARAAAIAAAGGLDPFRAAPPARSERGLLAQVRQLTGLVGELTLALVVQGAYLAALRNHRARPCESDVDEAIERVADNVPLAVAEELWAGRDALVARLRDGDPAA